VRIHSTPDQLRKAQKSREKSGCKGLFDPELFNDLHKECRVREGVGQPIAAATHRHDGPDADLEQLEARVTASLCEIRSLQPEAALVVEQELGDK